MIFARKSYWRPSGEGTPPPFNSCSACSCRLAKGSMQCEIGDLQEDDIMRTFMRHILQVVLAIHICAMWVSKTANRKVSWGIKNMKNMPCNLHVWCKLAAMAAKFTKMYVWCTRSFLLAGLRRLKMHKSWAKIKNPKGSKSGKIAIRTTRRATRASQMGKKGSSLGLSGGKRGMCLIGSAKIRFAKMCFP